MTYQSQDIPSRESRVWCREWFETALWVRFVLVDGLPGEYTDIVDYLVPELQKRGLSAANILVDNPGLKRAATLNLHAAAQFRQTKMGPALDRRPGD